MLPRATTGGLCDFTAPARFGENAGPDNGAPERAGRLTRSHATRARSVHNYYHGRYGASRTVLCVWMRWHCCDSCAS